MHRVCSTLSPKHSFPTAVVSSYSCIEVAKNNKLVISGGCLDVLVKFFIEVSLSFIGTCEGGCISTSNGKLAGLAEGDVELQEAFLDASWEH